MSDQTVDTGEREIIASILTEADTQAQRKRAEADRAAQAELDKARRQAETVRGRIMKEAEQTASRAIAKENAAARAEARRVLLTAREELVGHALQEIDKRLKALREDPEQYRVSLANLAKEAILAVDQPEVILKVSAGDNAITDATFLEDVSRDVKAAGGHVNKVTLEVAPGDLGGGCVVTSGNGRVVFDNTFRRRLEREMPAVRAALIEEMKQTDE